MGFTTKDLRAGYIFGVKDPDTGKYVYVGLARRPWEYIFRLLRSKQICPAFYNWAQELYDKHPVGVELYGEIICDRYWAELNGDPVPPMPEKHPYRTVLEWEILAVQDQEYHEDNILSVSVPSLRNRIIKKLRAEGHPILTKVAGRKKKGYVPEEENA